MMMMMMMMMIMMMPTTTNFIKKSIEFSVVNWFNSLTYGNCTVTEDHFAFTFSLDRLLSCNRAIFVGLLNLDTL